MPMIRSQAGGRVLCRRFPFDGDGRDRFGVSPGAVVTRTKYAVRTLYVRGGGELAAAARRTLFAIIILLILLFCHSASV